jgi:hypothetical protein
MMYSVLILSVPDEVASLTADMMPNSSIVVRWKSPQQSNGVLVGTLCYAS